MSNIEKLSQVRAEVITRISHDTWIRSRLNGGCRLSGNKEPKFDNQVKAALRAAEGFLDLSLTENHYEDKRNRFIDASVNFRDGRNRLFIRVDNQISSKIFHYNVKQNGNIIENHTPVKCDSSEQPLNFCLNKVIEYFNARFMGLKSSWTVFRLPPVAILGGLMTSNASISNVGVPLPIGFVCYPSSNVSVDVYSRKATRLDLIPIP